MRLELPVGWCLSRQFLLVTCAARQTRWCIASPFIFFNPPWSAQPLFFEATNNNHCTGTSMPLSQWLILDAASSFCCCGTPVSTSTSTLLFRFLFPTESSFLPCSPSVGFLLIDITLPWILHLHLSPTSSPTRIGKLSMSACLVWRLPAMAQTGRASQPARCGQRRNM